MTIKSAFYPALSEAIDGISGTKSRLKKNKKKTMNLLKQRTRKIRWKIVAGTSVLLYGGIAFISIYINVIQSGIVK